MSHHWFLNHADKNTNDHNNNANNILAFSAKQDGNKSFQRDKQNRLSTKETPTQSLKETQKTPLKQIPQTSIRNISQDNLDSPGMNNYSPTKMLPKPKRISFETNTIQSAFKNQTQYINSKSSSDDVANHALSFHLPDKQSTMHHYSVFNSKAETLYGWSIDETTHKKNYYKIKVSPIHAGYSYLGVTLENQTEKRQNTEQRIHYKTQSNLLADVLIANKTQAIEAIKLQRQGTSPQMIPLLQLINSVDFIQDSLLLKAGKDLGFISKSTFSLKNLLEEIQTVFKMTGSIDEQANTPTKTIKAGFFSEIPQRKSISGKPPKDSLFAPQRKTAAILDTSQLLPTTQSPLRKTLSNNIDLFSQKTMNVIGKLTPIDLSTSCVLQDDAFSIFNDKYRIKQVLIALASNMRCWHRALNNPISQENENNSNSKTQNDMELTCSEEKNQFCDFFTVNFKLQVKDYQLQCLGQETLLKYLNGVNNTQINKGNLLSIQSYIKMIGPYKLKTSIVEDKCIQISFDIFKNVDVMDIPEKNNQLNESLQSQSMLFQTSMNNFSNYQKGGAQQFRSLYLQQSQKLQGKSYKSQKSRKLDRSIKLGMEQYGQQSAQGFENQSESMISQGNEVSSIIGDPLNNQIQLAEGDTGGMKGEKISSTHNVLNKEVGKSFYSCQRSQDIEQSQDLTLKLPDLNSAIKMIFNQVGNSPSNQVNQLRILQPEMIQKSKLNQGQVEDSILSESKCCSLGESNGMIFNVQTNLTQVQAVQNIHTINSITNHLM